MHQPGFYPPIPGRSSGPSAGLVAEEAINESETSASVQSDQPDQEAKPAIIYNEFEKVPKIAG